MGSVGFVATDVLLIPGFWLNAESWLAVSDGLRARGLTVTALTLPGMSSVSDDRRGIGLREHVDAVVAAVDEAGGRVVLVGHSAGGAIVYAVADARPDRVARVVYVDAIPLGEGECINDELPEVGGEVPLPDWSAFGPEDLVDLTDELRASFRARAIPEPVGVARDRQRLSDPRRYDVPATIIACEFTGAQLREWIAEGLEWVGELAALRDVHVVDLPTGHWPQFTRPDDLVEAIWSALDDVTIPLD
jgi:pimeloyl-ACP methyl ester carboxylesterase